MLIHVIRAGSNQYDFVKDFMLDRLIENDQIAKFERSTGWVTVGVDPIRERKRDISFGGAERIEVNDSIYVREHRRGSQ